MQTMLHQRNVPPHSRCITTIVILLLLFCTSTSWALGNKDQGDFLLFPRVHLDALQNSPSQLELDDEELFASTSVFYAKNSGQLRFLGEFFLSDDEAEIERLQVGWSLNEQATTWAGRFHTPIGFWNQDNHHGAYLVTSATRPGIVEYEDDGGILPTHLTGLLLEGTRTYNSGTWEYSIGLGYAPNISDKGLKTVDIVDLSVSGHEPTIVTILTYAPDEFGPLRYGIFYLATTLASDVATITKVEQNVTGAYFHGAWALWKINAAYFVLNNRVRTPTNTSESDFSTGYIQIDHMLTETWSIYGRVEDSTGVKNDPYLSLFPGFVASRNLLGVRYDFIKNHALTLEFGSVNVGTINQSYDHLSVQWSAVFQ